jgi:hypothetical protein
MTIARFRRSALAFYGALAVAGCGGAPMFPSTSAASSPLTERASHAWMAPRAKSGDLLYLSDVSTNDVDVFSYPRARMVGKLTGFGAPRSECADRKGNVWIADEQGYDVIEYPHGSTKPIVALSTPGAPHGCSVDPKTGDLAVTGGVGGVILAVYHRTKHNKWLDPKEYTDSSIRRVAFCGFDAQGNLFIDGLDKGKGGTFRMAELPRHATSLMDLSVNQSIAGAGQVQWDGSALAVGDTGVTPSVIYRFAVSGSTATLIGSTTLDDTKSVRQFWVDAASVIGPDFDADAGIWKYPSGGSPVKRIGSVHGYGATVSLAVTSK